MLSGSREEKLRAQGVPPAIIASMRSFEEQQLEQRPAQAPSLNPQVSAQPKLRAVEEEPPQASETSHFPAKSVEQADAALESPGNVADSEIGSLSSSEQLDKSPEQGALKTGPHALQEAGAQPSLYAEGDGAPDVNTSNAAMRQSQLEQHNRQAWPRPQSSAHVGQSHDRMASGEGPSRTEQPGLPFVTGQNTASAEEGDHSTPDCSDTGKHDNGHTSTGVVDNEVPLNQESEVQRLEKECLYPRQP